MTPRADRNERLRSLQLRDDGPVAKVRAPYAWSEMAPGVFVGASTLAILIAELCQ